jgi:hypothetical protein
MALVEKLNRTADGKIIERPNNCKDEGEEDFNIIHPALSKSEIYLTREELAICCPFFATLRILGVFLKIRVTMFL